MIVNTFIKPLITLLQDLVHNMFSNISSVVEFQRWWVLKSNFFCKKVTWFKGFLLIFWKGGARGLRSSQNWGSKLWSFENLCSFHWIGEILNTKNQNNTVISWIFHKEWYCYFGFFWKFLTDIRVFTKKKHPF